MSRTKLAVAVIHMSCFAKEVIERDLGLDIAVEEGVDRIAAWTYRGGYGTVVGAPDALRLWDRIGENYRRVLDA